MLKPPSVVLEQTGASSRRQYASIVFRCLQQTSKDTNKIFTSCFLQETDAIKYHNHIQSRMDTSLTCKNKDMAEECIILPPLFWNSAEDVIVEDVDESESQLLLVMYQNGPIFPVVRVQKAEQIIGDMRLLDKLYHAYEALSSERATRDNVLSVIQNCAKQ